MIRKNSLRYSAGSSNSRSQRISDPGNTLKNARKLGTLQSPLFAKDAFRRLSNSVKGRTDSDDYYKFTLKRASNLSLRLDGLQANADVEVFRLDQKGRRTRNPKATDNLTQRTISNLTISPKGGVRASQALGTDFEDINLFRLPPGQYAIRVHTKDTAKTNYNLSLFASPSAKGNFNIEFDYRFADSFFSEEVKANLAAAAYVWESWINDEFPNIASGTEFFQVNPATSEFKPLRLEYPIDDLVIFVGADSDGGANAGPTGSSSDPVLSSRKNGSNFEPWAGSIRYGYVSGFFGGDPTKPAKWLFDSTPSTSWDIRIDPSFGGNFFRTTLHEIGHILGFVSSGIPIFQQNLSSDGQFFTGSNAKRINLGNPIPFSSSVSHIERSFTIDGQTPIMGNIDPGYGVPANSNLKCNTSKKFPQRGSRG